MVWWNRSSLQGNYKSRIRVGDYFHSMFEHKPLGYAAAAAHYLSSALHKTPQASYNMAICYKQAKGVPKDTELSELFMADVLRFDKTGTAKWPVYLTQRYFGVVEWVGRYGLVILLVLVIWLFLFTVMVGVLLIYDTYYTHHTTYTNPNTNPNTNNGNQQANT